MQVVDLLLEHGARCAAGPATACTACLSSALLAASEYDHPRVVRRLLAHGADVHAEQDKALRAVCVCGGEGPMQAVGTPPAR